MTQHQPRYAGPSTPAPSAVNLGRLRANAIRLLSSNGAYALCQWLIIITLAVLGGATVVGIYALGTALSMPFVAFSQLGLRQVLLNDVNDSFAFRTYLRVRIIGSIASCLSIVGLAIALGYHGETLWVIAAVGLARCVESVTDIQFGYLQKKERLQLVLLLTSTGAVINLTAVAGTYAVSRSIVAASTAFAVSSLITCIAAGVVTRAIERRSAKHTQHSLSALAYEALPAGVASFLASLSGNAPRYVVEHLGGPILLGQYAVIEQFLVLGSLATNSVGQASAPDLARGYASDSHLAFTRTQRAVVLFGATVGVVGLIGAWLVGGQLIAAIYGPGFELASEAFVPLMAAAAFYHCAAAISYPLIATKQYLSLMWRNATTAILVAVIAILAFPYFGLSGVALAVGVSSIASAALAWHGVRLAILGKSRVVT